MPRWPLHLKRMIRPQTTQLIEHEAVNATESKIYSEMLLVCEFESVTNEQSGGFNWI